MAIIKNMQLFLKNSPKPLKQLFSLCFLSSFFYSDISSSKQETLALNFPRTIIERLEQTSSDITVQIWNEKFLGSGVIISKQGNNYEIITNKHVLARSTSYLVKTPDGKFYQAQVATSNTDKSWDLAFPIGIFLKL